GQSTAIMPRPSAAARMELEPNARSQGPRGPSSADSTRLRFQPTTSPAPAIPHEPASAAAARPGDPAARNTTHTDAPNAARAAALANSLRVPSVAAANATALAPARRTGPRFTASASSPR